MVAADHTSSQVDEKGNYQWLGVAVGFVIEFEDGFKVYASGDTGLTSDMKLVIADYFKPDLALLPAIGFFVMEPEQAVFASEIIRPKYVIPFHDFPEEAAKAADPQTYEAIAKQFPVLQPSRAKVRKFIELMKKNPKIEVIALDFGETKEIG